MTYREVAELVPPGVWGLIEELLAQQIEALAGLCRDMARAAAEEAGRLREADEDAT